MSGVAVGTKESVVRGTSARESGMSEWVAISGALRKLSVPVDVFGIRSISRGRELSWTLSAIICQI